ncbi:HEAT repeat domain-containing protein [Thermoleptolyngbya sp. C42_A2020_037]|uniref:HEAT repeat domain-containing protein n=1 Tax=Thermoleptolyngbya sp. C42_A2020_037 TaxID=2747799 RepID=UPI0025DC403D|nr:HEAT repeat domain-containing protein [Thermoleptolyngbya sp. C42_A2020_037]
MARTGGSSRTTSAKKSRLPAGRTLLQWLNLRPEESERTFLMFAFYTATSIGVLWLEVSIAALFLDEYGANSLPWIYIVSAGIGTVLGFFYSLLQKFLPLRQVIVVIAVLMALPLPLFRLGLAMPLMMGYSVFLMRLWMEAIYVLNELTTSITANQLFNIREIKRAYPMISSGVLLADVLSGLSLPLLRSLVGLNNVVLLAGVMLMIGAGILYRLSRSYSQFFPDSPRRLLQERQPDFTTRRLRRPLQRYVILLVAFFVMAQVLWLLLDFQYLAQLERRVSGEQLADFLAFFSAILGTFELLVQWFVSSRAIERLGVFVVTMALPALIFIISLVSMMGWLSLFIGMVILKFADELLRYTVLASTGPILFQPVPDNVRSRVQSIVRGIAEPFSSGLTGVGMLMTLWLCQRIFNGSDAAALQDAESLVFMFQIMLCGALWFVTVWLLRSRYVDLLVISADRGELSLSDVDLRTFKRAVIDALGKGTDADKQSCIELLAHIDPKGVGEVLAPMLSDFSPALQRQSLLVMTENPNPLFLPLVRSLIEQPLPPDVLSIALRYIWLTDPDPDIERLRPYLNPSADPEVRGTAASLMLRRGTPEQRAEATDTLRRMLTHKRERERVMGCRALGEALYLQALRIYIEPLLRDESLRVRCALLEAIAATRTEEYYPSLLRALQFKSTREAAMQALTRLGDDAIPLLVTLGKDTYKPEIIRTCAWKTLGRIGTPDAVRALVRNLETAWGPSRRTILRTLLKIPNEVGIDAVADELGRSGVEELINLELMLIGQVYACLLDLPPERVPGQAADLLRRALSDLQDDARQRLFLLMRLLYPSSAIQAAAFNLQSHSSESVARGLEILDNTLDIQSKRALLSILDSRPDLEKLESLDEFVDYQPLSPSDRLRHLLDLRHFLSDWGLACSVHVAREQRWSLMPAQIIACLHHPTGFVREAAVAYLEVASPRTLRELLPMLSRDPNRLVAAQVEQLLQKYSAASTHNGNGKILAHPAKPPDPPPRFNPPRPPDLPMGWEPT